MSLIKTIFVAICVIALFARPLSAQPLPDTGISGVYEVVVGASQTGASETQPAFLVRYFAEFGFRVVDSASFTPAQAKELYGVESGVKSYRLQNGAIDSHGLLRILAWEKPLGNGVGYNLPETIGSRMAVMKTRDVIRIVDIFKQERANGKKWLPIDPIFDDLYKMTDKQPDFFTRPTGVRETAIYGDWFIHVFFQRYGYNIPGYGTINDSAPLQTSEFTHHDFFISAQTMDVTNYYRDALGFKPEKDAEVDGDWLRGPQRVFDMQPGSAHIYKGFVSPNNVCGKLKFFIPQAPKPDRSAHQRVGELGITMHSLWTPKLDMVFDLVKKQGISPTKIQKNELGERCFVFKGPDGVSWQIIEKMETKNKPVTKFELQRVNN